MWTEKPAPANDPGPPAARADTADAKEAEARLDRFLADPLVQRMLRSDGAPGGLMIRAARAARRQIAEARTHP